MNNLEFLKRINECKKNYSKMILIIGDSHGENLFNSSTHYLKNKFIVGLNLKGCRFYSNKDKNCHYDTSLDFIENNRNFIAAVFFKSKSSYLLTDISNGEHPSNPNFRKLPILINNVEGEIEYLEKNL